MLLAADRVGLRLTWFEARLAEDFGAALGVLAHRRTPPLLRVAWLLVRGAPQRPRRRLDVHHGRLSRYGRRPEGVGNGEIDCTCTCTLTALC